MNAGDLTAAHRGQQIVVRIPNRVRVAGELLNVAHLESGTQITVRTDEKQVRGWESVAVDHDHPVELKEPK